MNSIKTYVEGKSLKVFFIINYHGKRFQVYTGISSTVKFSGMVFPKNVPNARAKTAALARLFSSAEEYIYMNSNLPAARRSWATIAAELDIPKDTIGKALGHSEWDSSTTDLYIKFDNKKIDEANRKVIDYLNG